MSLHVKIYIHPSRTYLSIRTSYVCVEFCPWPPYARLRNGRPHARGLLPGHDAHGRRGASVKTCWALGLQSTCTYTHLYMYVSMLLYRYLFIYLHVYIYISVYLYVMSCKWQKCLCVRMVFMCMCICSYEHVYIHMCLCAYVHRSRQLAFKPCPSRRL